LAFVLEGIC